MSGYNPNPTIYVPPTGTTSNDFSNAVANVTSGASQIDVKIAELKLAFFDELQKYVNQTDNAGVATITNTLQTLLGSLGNLNVTMLSLLTSPSSYDSAYTTTILDALVALVNTAYDTATLTSLTGSVNTGYSTTDIDALVALINTAYESSALSALNSTAASPFTHDNLTSLDAKIAANLANTGTGLPTATETAMWDRGRARINFASARAARRINAIESARLPYAGAATDAILEHDQDQVWALADLNYGITVKQAEMTYDFQRKKITEAISALGELNLRDHLENKNRIINATVQSENLLSGVYDKNKDRILQGTIQGENIKADTYDKNLDRIIQSTVQSENIKSGVYDKNKDRIIQSTIQKEDLKMKDHHENLRRKLDAYTKYDALALQNHWNYYEYLIKKYLAYIEGAEKYILKIVNGGEQITFENWMEMSKTLMSAHFQMAAVVSDISGSV